MKDLEMALNVVSRLVVVFLASVFLLAEFIFGNFEWRGTAIGIGGFAVAGLTGWSVRIAPLLDKIGMAGGALALIGASFDIYSYFDVGNGPGEHNDWVIVLPLVLAVLYLMIATARSVRLR